MDKAETNRTDFAPLRRHPVLAFFVIAFLISWVGVILIILPTGIPGRGDDLDRLYGFVFMPMLAGPFLSALFMSALLGGWSEVWGLLRKLTIWRANPIEYAASFLLIPTCAVTVLMLLSLVSPNFMPGFMSPNSTLSAIAIALLGGFAIGLIEETGWTGFAASRLLGKNSLMFIAISIGLVHGFWHFLVAVWADGAESGILIIPLILTLWVLALLVMRILIVWAFARTGSTLLAAIAHASHSGMLFAVWPPATTPMQDVIWTAAFGAVGLIAVLLVFAFAPARNPRTEN
jgi:membrane protease YdiL (CAAX protease family)